MDHKSSSMFGVQLTLKLSVLISTGRWQIEANEVSPDAIVIASYNDEHDSDTVMIPLNTDEDLSVPLRKFHSSMT